MAHSKLLRVSGPVCLLRRAMRPVATAEDDLADDGRFDQYEMMRREDGTFESLIRRSGWLEVKLAIRHRFH
jgi:hypothetical protein